MKVVIAAAQTGGHINPGIAIANKLTEEIKNCEITFIGTIRGLENDLVPRAGYKLETVEAYGINRKFSFNNFINILKTLKGFQKVKKLIKKINPDIVIGTGGFICGPVLTAAIKYKIPTILHESNAFPGIAVKLLSKKVDTILVGFEETKKQLPKAKNVVITGTPTKLKKIELTIDKKDQIRKGLGIENNLPIVLIFGGSQGAKSINSAMINIITKQINNKYQMIWATGQKQYENIKEILFDKKININNIDKIKIMPYIYNMEEVMNLADIIVSRSGAMTVTEVSKLAKPAIFIPFPFATENHQEYNAKVLENVGAAKIILDKDLTEDILLEQLDNIFVNDDNLIKMGNKAEEISKKDVLGNIYLEIKKLIKTGV